MTVNIRGFKQTHAHKKDGLTDNDIALIQGHCKIEVCPLNVEHIDLQKRSAFITGKGRDDEEIIWLHHYTVKALKEYLWIEKIKLAPYFKAKVISIREVDPPLSQ